MVFPINPTPGQQHTEENTLWVYAGPSNGWYRQTVNPGNSTTYTGSLVTSSKIVNGTIVNTDISDSAAIQGSKILPAFGQQTVSALGLAFPSSSIANSDPNTLDDYEEGTWIPTLAFGGGTTGITYNGRYGAYLKLGRLVNIYLFFSLSSKGSSTGSATITGLPFLSSNVSVSGLGVWPGGGYPTRKQNHLSSSLALIVGLNSTSISFTDGAGSPISDTSFTNGVNLECSLSYLASA